MDTPDLERAILELVNAPGYHPVKPRVIAKRLGLTVDQPKDFKRVIKRLVKSGQLAYAANHLIGPPGSAKPARVTGIFRRTQAGHGFVRPAGTAPGTDKTKDIYVTSRQTQDAATGDTVLVKLRKKRDSSRPNPEGEIVEIVRRETNRFVGTYFEADGAAFVRVDGKIFSQPVLVGDPGAKNAQVDDKVVFEMVRFPSHMHDGEGVIVEVLGPHGSPGVDTLSIIHEYGLPQEFPEDVLEAARREADRFTAEVGDRLDLTEQTIITIDPVDARDFDDAISLERMSNGHWRLGVHIADVAHFVKAKSPLDREAYERATSVYLPDRVLPMLPEVISNSLASLQPDKVRYTKTVFLEFTDEGVRTSIEPHNAAICSKRRFTYEEVDEYLADREAWREKLTPDVHRLLGDMHTLAMTLRRRRMERGALELSMREVKIDLDKQGRVTGAHVVQNTESHQIIEEFMLAANEAVADLFERRDILFLRRVHEAPDPRKLLTLTKFVAELGFRTESLESRFELQKLLGAVVGLPEQHAVNYAVLRSMQRAAYSPIDEGHYALASETYCHFTSPIRRYPDLTVHRLLDAVMARAKIHNDFDALSRVGEQCSDREQRADQAERELTKLKLMNYLADHIGLELDAVVTGVEEFGLFAQGVELPAEGLVHISSLNDDFYRFNRDSHTLEGYRQGNRYRLGDLIRVVVARVDVHRRELDFRLVARQERPNRAVKPTERSTRTAKGGSRKKRSAEPKERPPHRKGKRRKREG